MAERSRRRAAGRQMIDLGTMTIPERQRALADAYLQAIEASRRAGDWRG